MAFFHILSNLLFINHPSIKCYMIWVSDSIRSNLIHRRNKLFCTFDNSAKWSVLLLYDHSAIHEVSCNMYCLELHLAYSPCTCFLSVDQGRKNNYSCLQMNITLLLYITVRMQLVCLWQQLEKLYVQQENKS